MFARFTKQLVNTTPTTSHNLLHALKKSPFSSNASTTSLYSSRPSTGKSKKGPVQGSFITSRSHPSSSSKPSKLSPTPPTNPQQFATKQFSTFMRQMKNVNVITPINHTNPSAIFLKTSPTSTPLIPLPTSLRSTLLTTTNQSSLIVTALIGAVCGVSAVVLQGWLNGDTRSNGKIVTFADIEKILQEPELDTLTFGADILEDTRPHKARFHEYCLEDYRLVMSLPEDNMPIKEKVDALRQILLRHINQTFPIYNLLESKLAYLNNGIFDKIYLQRGIEAKLLHRAMDLPIDQSDVEYRTQRDGVQQIFNPEQLSQLRNKLTMMNNKAIHDYPTREQSEYLNQNELNEVYRDLVQFCMDSSVTLTYYKFLSLLFNLENVIDDNDEELFSRLDTTVTSDHNTHGNAFTDTVDELPQLTLQQRSMIYRNKTLEVISSVMTEMEFLIDAMPQINDALRNNAKNEVYRLARMVKRDQQLDQGVTDGEDGNNNDLTDEEKEQKRLNKLINVNSSQNDNVIFSPEDLEELDKQVDVEYNMSKIEYDAVAVIHRTLYERWLRLAFTNEERIGMMPVEQLDGFYRSLRENYLDAKAKESIPRAFLETYNVNKPLQYNELYNQAYLLLPKHEMEAPLAKYYVNMYELADERDQEITKAGL